MFEVAYSYSSLDHHEKALQLMEHLVETAKRTQGKDNDFTYLWALSVATSYAQSGRPDKGLHLTEKVQEMRRQSLGDDHFQATITELIKENLQALLTLQQKNEMVEQKWSFRQLYGVKKTWKRKVSFQHANGSRSHTRDFSKVTEISKADGTSGVPQEETSRNQ